MAPWSFTMPSFTARLLLHPNPASKQFTQQKSSGTVAKANKVNYSALTMRTFLNVPFADKDKAKSLGAKWSPGHKSWYIEDLEDIEPFLQWIPEHLKKPTSPKKKK